MISEQKIMEQAPGTMEVYYEGADRLLSRTDIRDDLAVATFLSGYLQACSTDYLAGMVRRLEDKIDEILVLSK